MPRGDGRKALKKNRKKNGTDLCPRVPAVLAPLFNKWTESKEPLRFTFGPKKKKTPGQRHISDYIETSRCARGGG